jgi:ribosomal protein S11
MLQKSCRKLIFIYKIFFKRMSLTIRPAVIKKKPALFILLTRTKNNLFLAVTKSNGRPLCQTSAGVIGLSGSRRDTPTSAEVAGKSFVKQISKLGYGRCYLRIKGRFDTCVRAAARGLSASPVVFSKLDHIKPTTHNGIRLRKPRRM